MDNLIKFERSQNTSNSMRLNIAEVCIGMYGHAQRFVASWIISLRLLTKKQLLEEDNMYAGLST